MSDVRVGTSGWSYPEWVGPFYPEKTSAARMLPYYARWFTTVEAHSTHRRLPTQAALQRWAASVPSDFRFAPKAHAGITHRRDLEGLPERMALFVRSLQPLEDRLGPVLFVLPHRRPDLPRLDTLLAALSEVGGVQAVFELAPPWWVDEVFDRLATHAASLAVVDRDDSPVEPTSPPPVGPVAYVRLRRSRYTDDELSAWAGWLGRAPGAKTGVYAFVKHDEQGDAPRYARFLVNRLERT